jgi:RNA polymerase sigma-70 factor (ECF subfamily)
MLKVFRNIEQYKGEGELMAWVRKIIVNVCIDSSRKKIKFPTTEINNTVSNLVPVIPEVYTKISGSEIMALIYELPKNTGLVFNLFVMEGYKHEEIGKMLGISTGTSKWHVNEARRLLKQRIETIFKKEFLANAI